MSRKSMADKLKQTTTEQQQDNLDRFAKADTALLNGGSRTKPEPVTKEESETLMVRDGFLLPEDDHNIIQRTRDRLVEQGLVASKAEVIRMALRALEKTADKPLTSLYRKLEPVRRGRKPYK
ncbi:MAG: hypothetical protein ACR2PT_15530 [Endozoicomonas sp.]